MRDPLKSIAAFLALLATLSTPARAGEVFASLGTGEVNGVYYPAGRAICDLVNQALSTTGVRCSAESTPGSVYNVDEVRSGKLEFAIIQSDIAFAAYKGEGAWIGKPFTELRSMFVLHPELVTIIARSGAGIHELADLAGKRLNIGRRGNGTRSTWDAMEAALGWKEAQRVRPTEHRSDATIQALCKGDIDANLLIGGHPSPLVRSQLSACATNLVALGEPAIDKILAALPYFHRGGIPGDLHGLPTDVPSFGVSALLVTSANVDKRVVAVAAKAVIAHVAELRATHPALARVRTEEMIAGWLPAPFHPGAVQAYKELDLLN
jgi:TRAP transporter TAXI family solute receptor